MAHPHGSGPGADRSSEVWSGLLPVVAELGVDLEQVDVIGSGRNRRLVVAVDADGGVGIDQIAEVTRAISQHLDAGGDEPLGTTPYTLEVSSRGTSSPLTLPRHWRRGIGRMVAVDTVGGERFEARITSVDETGVELTDRHGATRWPFDDIDKAVIQIEFNRKDV